MLNRVFMFLLLLLYTLWYPGNPLVTIPPLVPQITLITTITPWQLAPTTTTYYYPPVPTTSYYYILLLLLLLLP